MSTFPTCPQCGLENTYSDGALWVCPDCGHEWGDDAPGQAEAGPVVLTATATCWPPATR